MGNCRSTYNFKPILKTDKINHFTVFALKMAQQSVDHFQAETKESSLQGFVLQILTSHWIEMISFDTFDLLTRQFHPEATEELFFMATDRWATACCVSKNLEPKGNAKRDTVCGLQI